MTYDRDFTGKAAIAAVQYGKEGEYWLKKFSGELQKTTFHYDYNIKSQPEQHIKDNITFKLRDPYVSMLIELSKGLDYRIYIILAASLVTLLYKYTGNKDIIIGSPIFKQDKDGNFINTMLPLRNTVDGAMIFKELLLNHVRQSVIEANEHQNYPIETLLFQLNMPVTPGEFPLFDVVILLENLHEKKYIHTVHPNLIFSFLRTNDGIEGKVEYNPALYKPDTIHRIIQHYERLLEQVLVNVDIFISGIDILGGEEKKKILYDFNRGNQQARYPHHKTLHQLFAEQVERTPDNIALGGPLEKKYRTYMTYMSYISYRELNEKSDRLAGWLIEKGVKPDTIVSIMLERSLPMIIGILGILKAGGAYLPIDPDYPEERISYMLADSRAKVLVTTSNLAEEDEKLRSLEVKRSHETIFIDTIDASNPSSSQLLNFSTSPSSLAYIIYTSGTTGKPKGSLITHRNVVSLMVHENDLFDFGSSDVWTMFHSYCFDFSVWEMYGALLYGGKLVLISKMMARDPQQYLQVLKAEQVTILNQTPAAFYQLAQQELDSPGKNLRLKYVIFGGEALTPAKLKPWKEKYPRTKLINMFGITETTVHVTYKEIDHKDIQLSISNIGGPLPTLNTYVMDRHQKVLPIGVPGELSVSGAGVCRGYLNQPELTAERFVISHSSLVISSSKKLSKFTNDQCPMTNDLSHTPHSSIYRSGDLARWLPDGNIEYLGRIDHQVKIRGYRVELGEIEAQLMRHFVVKEAAALEWEDTDGLKALNAYVVPDPQYAYPVKQLTALERAGRLENLLYHEYPNGMTIFYINRHETDFMYREIFEEQSYTKPGITLEEGACIFDVGANIGMFSLFVNHTCKNPKIYAFEPIPPIFEVLSLNTSIYCRNLEVFSYGLSQKESEAVFTYYPHAAVLSGRFADQSQETETIKTFIENEPKENPEEERLSEGQINELLEDRLKSTSFNCRMKSLSQIIREKGIEKIDLLKIDVEKAEIDVLKGIDEDDWPKIRQLVIEVHDVDEGLEKITQQLHQRGYRVVVQQDSKLKNTNLYNVYAVSEAKFAPGPQPPTMVEKNDGDDRHYYLSPGRFIDDLRIFSKEKVPEYMVPSYFVLLDHIPLNPNGKVDRKALPNPEIKTGKKFIAPGNRVEIKLAEIWAEVLGIEKEAVGIDSDFFQLGGHSLKATIFISKLHKVLNTKIPLAVLFKTPTIRQLAEYIGGLKMNRFIGLGAVEKKGYYQPSSAQKRLYVLQQMELESIAYNVPQAYELEGELNRKALENTFRQLIKRHESLRTFFAVVNAEPVQRMHEDINFKIEYFDFNIDRVEEYEGTWGGAPVSVEPAAPSPQPAATLISSFVRPFDLHQTPLLRMALIKVEDRKHILMIDMHHIVTDGTSTDLFVKESMALYAGEPLPPLKFQYKDYSQWQNSPQQKKAVREQEEYWLRQFPDEVPVLNLPLDYSRPEVQSFEGAVLSFEVPGELTRSINRMALDTGVTLYMVLLAGYNILLSKISGQEDIVVGTPTAARRHADLDRIIGIFVNTLAMRNYPQGNKKFIDFLKELKKRTLAAFEHQEYQFEDLVEKVYVNRDLSRNPLFDALFGLQNMEGQASEIPVVDISHLKIRPYEDEHRTAKFDLNLTCFENEEKLFCFFEYCTKLFKKETIERFFLYFKQILAAVLTDSNKKISQIEIITPEEKQRLLYDINDTAAAYPEEKTLHRLFEEQVERTPDNIAVVGEMQSAGRKAKGIERNKERHAPCAVHRALTYRELNEKSHRLAGLLIEKGVKPDTIVGIMLERSLEMIVGILGILKAGGAYLPIDPDYPEERIRYMLADSSADVLVTSSSLFEDRMIGSWEGGLVFLSAAINNSPLERGGPKGRGVSNLATRNPQPATRNSQLAYIIYTSGTTGNPKGVLIQHQNVVRLMFNDKYRFDFNDTDIWTLFHSICFDFSVWEIYGALLYGGKSVIIPKMLTRDPDGFLDLLTVQKVTVLNQTPSVFYQLLDRSLNAPGKKLYLKYVIFGGEALNPARLKAWKNRFPDTKTVNMYGITETTVHVTYKEITDKEMELNTGNIGTQIATLTVYVMDRYLKLSPLGVAGELCVGGQGVARGYLNRPGLTSEKFIKNPYRPDEKLYKSGDLVRLSNNGDMEYLARIDQQVKIRGHRIEPGEVETQLLNHGEVKETVVVVKEDKSGDKYLCVYVVPESKSAFNALVLKEHLAGKLPGYMIPSYFIALERFPLTTNGKIDRKALPEPEIKAGESYAPPQDKLEKKLVEIWAEVLEISPDLIGVDTNFFQLGGHSLKAASVISGIYDELYIRVPLIEIFRTPTVRQLAQYIKYAEGKSAPITDKNLVLLKKSTGGAGHLFFIHDGTGDVEGYIEFCKDLNIDIHCWGIRAAPLENYTPVNLSIENIAANYIKILRKVQPHGPYCIAGWSLGGVIAFEMVLQLETLGQNTSFLGLIDAPTPQMEGNNDVIPFGLQTETNLLINYITNNEIKEKVKNISNVNEIWPAVIDCLEENNISVDTIKPLIPGALTRIIPNYDRAGIRDLIYYLNMNRTLTHALPRYLPCKQINTPIHYFKASQSPEVVKKVWHDYCKKSLEIHQVEGDHFSILRKPAVKRLGKIFAAVLKEVCSLIFLKKDAKIESKIIRNTLGK